MQDYRNLRVWQKAHQLGIDAYALPEYLQEPKGWALRDQILKAVISISSNIAEGAGRGCGILLSSTTTEAVEGRISAANATGSDFSGRCRKSGPVMSNL